MTASRWHTGPLEVFDWLQDTDSSLEELFLPSIISRFQKKTNRKKVP